MYLHEHLVHDYVQCWQQGLSDGEWDAAACDMGVSRWFNYYANGVGAPVFLSSLFCFLVTSFVLCLARLCVERCFYKRSQPCFLPSKISL